MTKNATIFESHIDLSNINNSMELDSGQEIARLDKGNYVVTLEVCGAVRVVYKDCTYKAASQMPEKLIQMFHNWKPEYEEVVFVDDNNWFEMFIWQKGDDGNLIWLGFSEVCDSEGADAASLRKDLEDYLNENMGTIEIMVNPSVAESA